MSLGSKACVKNPIFVLESPKYIYEYYLYIYIHEQHIYWTEQLLTRITSQSSLHYE